MKKGILFDLDGTLWDASKEVAVSWMMAIKDLPQVHFPVNKLERYFEDFESFGATGKPKGENIRAGGDDI